MAKPSSLLKIARQNILLVLSGLLLVGSIIVERVLLAPAIVYPHPYYDPLFVARTVVIAISSGLLIYALARRGRTGEPAEPIGSPVSLVTLASWASLFLGAACLGLFIVNADLFVRATYEDGPIEYLSAIGLFIATGLMLLTIVFIAKSNKPYKRWLIAAGLFLSVVFFVIGMEEVSWFQRVLEFETPEAFAANRQGEFNLHNFDSNTSEEVYYFGAFVILILLPFAAHQGSLPRPFSRMNALVPTTAVLFASALLAAYNYNLWNRTTIQFTSFATLWILGFYAYQALRQRQGSFTGFYLPILVFVLYIATQVLFLIGGDRFTIAWTVTEYKELLIPLGFVIFTFEVAYRNIFVPYPQRTPVEVSAT
jgi:hypothetical protein